MNKFITNRKAKIGLYVNLEKKVYMKLQKIAAKNHLSLAAAVTKIVSEYEEDRKKTA